MQQRASTFDVRLVSILADNLERPVLDVLLNCGIIHLATNEPLSIENGVDRIHGRLILRGVTDQTLGLGESHPRRSGSVALIISNDFNTFILPDSYAGIRCAEVNTNGWPVNLLRIPKYIRVRIRNSSTHTQTLITKHH